LMKVEGAAIRISFTHAEGLTTHYPADLYTHVSGPAAPPTPMAAGAAAAPPPAPLPIPPNDAPLKGFQIAGPDNHFVDATATISGSTILVSSPEVPNPASVRYAWDNYPFGANLYNSAGLPAAPFRTNQNDTPVPLAPPAPGL